MDRLATPRFALFVALTLSLAVWLLVITAAARAGDFASSQALRLALSAPPATSGPALHLRQGWYMPDVTGPETGAAAYGVASRGVVLGLDIYSGLAYAPSRYRGDAASMAGYVGVIVPLD